MQAGFAVSKKVEYLYFLVTNKIFFVKKLPALKFIIKSYLVLQFGAHN